MLLTISHTYRSDDINDIRLISEFYLWNILKLVQYYSVCPILLGPATFGFIIIPIIGIYLKKNILTVDISMKKSSFLVMLAF